MAILTVLIFSTCLGIISGNTCYSERRSRYYTSCGLLGFFRCTRYRDVTYAFCCFGWTGEGCNDALCDGKTNQNGACNLHEGYVKESASGPVHTSSGGKCDTPGVCTDCNNGYYADEAYCRECPPIANCYYTSCSNKNNGKCEYCKGVVKDDELSYGWWAYTRWMDNGLSCKRACSWREGSRCYPGACPDTTEASCKCDSGFSGTDCKTMTESPKILQSFATLKEVTSTSEERIDGPHETAAASPQSPVWTNNVNVHTVDASVEAQYVKDISDISNPPSYIDTQETQFGIMTGGVRFKLKRGGSLVSGTFSHPCPLSVPKENNYKCTTTFNFGDKWSSSLPLKHLDTIVFETFATNGGYVSVFDRENNNNRVKYTMAGKTVTYTYDFKIDTERPVQCKMDSSCSHDPLTTPNVVKDAVLPISWDGWKDSVSGLKSYHIEVFHLRSTGAGVDSDLTHGNKIIQAISTEFGPNAKETSVTVPSPGPISITLTAVDIAGNGRTARRVLIYDDKSVVELQGSRSATSDLQGACTWTNAPSPPLVTNAEPKSDCDWINKPTSSINVAWKNRFINLRHHTGLWLNSVASVEHIDDILDDHEGEKQITKTDNVLGIVKFAVSYNITYNGKEEHVPFTDTDDLYSESARVFEEMIDGKRINITIRGYDITGAYKEDSVVIKSDLSPPITQNIGLTRGDNLNISVHNVEELVDMTMEWETYDYHSGIHEIKWRLYDNYTGEDVQHGLAYESPQGDTRSMSHCKQTYGQYARGAKCYCTPYDGCFHKHFQVKPLEVTGNTSGITTGKHIGTHDTEYFLEVTVTNKAMLTSQTTMKITIDISPPVAGTVQDGMSSDPEVDFQKSKIIHVHWSDFFDKESGVLFYKYGFGNQCLQDEDFSFDSNQIFKTYNQHASFDVETEGTYYVTVVAFNRALDHSVPVCSDGVTIDTSVPAVHEVIVKGVNTRERLLKSAVGTVWYLHNDRSIQIVQNPTENCRESADYVDDDELLTFPLHTDTVGRKKSLSNAICNTSNSVHPQRYGVVSSTTSLEISWSIKTPETHIHDFKVGLGSTGSGRPDIVPFQTSHRHQHIRLQNPEINDGEVFYIAIETMTKSAVINIQVVGPFIVDVSQPTFQGYINVTYNAGFLIGQWNSDAFIDTEDFAPLKIEFAIGTSPYAENIHSFGSLQSGHGCEPTEQTYCTAVDINELEWSLHGRHIYYMTIKATNTGGLFVLATSSPYKHDVLSPRQGVVLDIDDTEYAHVLDDIDFQTSLTAMKAKWYGFDQEDTDVRYIACVAEEGTIDMDTCVDAGSLNEIVLDNLKLAYFTRYQFVIKASSNSGNTTGMSDGVTILDTSSNLDDIGVYDGVPCMATAGSTNSNLMHNEQDINTHCEKDLTHQTSLNSMAMYWTVPDNYKIYTPDVYWSIQERAPTADVWTSVTERLHTSQSFNQIVTNHVLQSGRTYRFNVQMCAYRSCFPEMFTDGVTITHSPPSSGTIDIKYSEADLEVVVKLRKFRDSDIEYIIEAQEAISHYEWAITNNGHSGKTVTEWTLAENITGVDNDRISFNIQLKKAIHFTNCWKISVRGYNKAGLYSVVSGEILDCNDKDKVPNPVVIDAVGNIVLHSDGTESAEPISVEKSSDWLEPDKDYTSATNMISALWPSLRYPSYDWAILKHVNEDSLLFYRDISDLDLTVPCDLPEAISCGQTAGVFINVDMDPGKLVHGTMYFVCIHANSTALKHEYWDEELPSISACSDGITVDTTPPRPGAVWISERDAMYQTSLSELTVYWESFIDIEELNQNAHSTGIMKYEVAIGTHAGDEDVVGFTDVGITNHITLHGLSLQNGHKYYATIKGYDYVMKEAKSVSKPIIIDSTPPIISAARIHIGKRHITDKRNIEPCWTGMFSDPDSGVAMYRWGIGSRPGHDDVYPYTDSEEECAQTDQSVMMNLTEGHMYYISVMAFNTAYLGKLAASWAFTFDNSPPNTGSVYDGKEDGPNRIKDIDYQSNTHTLMAYWSGFTDPHTNIQEYFVEVGTRGKRDNIVHSLSTGVSEEVVLEHLHLAEGTTYFVSITACNTAGLCSTSTSDGVTVDSSPPVPGHVSDGAQTMDINYQLSSNLVAARWFGFVDAHSGISHYTWRVGTAPGGDDVVPVREVHKAQIAVIADLEDNVGWTLPEDRRLYSTVRAYNKAGLSAESTSNGFEVDITVPVFVLPIRHVSVGSIVITTSILKSVLKFEWEIEDEESYIERQFLSILPHLGEDFNMSVEVHGFVRDYTFTQLKLHDGSLYDVVLTSCNGAGACVKSSLENILVDASPPTAGTFAISTEHAAELNRQPKLWMTWTNSNLDLAWLGFSDEHSGVSYYMINIGSHYMGSDLNNIPGTALRVDHDEDTHYVADDGKVQVYTIPTQSLNAYDHIFITLWAVNGVGLRSEIIHSLFLLISGGDMELIRRCTSYSCQGHCVCAARNRKCNVDLNLPNCDDVRGDATFATVIVTDIVDLSDEPENINANTHTPSVNMLSARWHLTGQYTHAPQWYEWSIGLTDHDTPIGIFNTQERVWHEAANIPEIYYTLQNGQTLHDGEMYSVFVRAWYNGSSFAVYKSTGVIVQSNHPETTNLFKKAVKEVYINHNNKDIDFVSPESEIGIDWTGKFKSNSDNIWKYKVFLSSHPGGHDLHLFDEYLPSDANSVNVTLNNLDLQPGVRYYTTVQAYNRAGLHNAVVSDGFVLDIDEPVTGIVNDGADTTDIQYQNSSTLMAAHWHGFFDQHSSLKSYRWCVSTDENVGTCDVVPFTDVGLKTRSFKEVDKQLESGTKIINEVVAVDGVGHVSNVTTSDGVTLDTSPPRFLRINDIGPNLVHNPSFEELTETVELKEFVPQRECEGGLVPDWVTVGCSSVVVATVDEVYDGKACVWVRGSVSQTVTDLHPGKTYKLSFYVSHLFTNNSALSHEEGFVEFGGERHMFRIYSKPGHQDNIHSPMWQLHMYYISPNAASNVITIGSFPRSYGLAFDTVRLQELQHSANNDDNSKEDVQMVFVHDWSSVHALWKSEDLESGIKDYMWAIGTVEGGTQLQTFINVGTKTFGTNSNLHLPHMSRIHVTVVATNGADLKTVSYLDPVIVDLTPPDVLSVNDGLTQGVDIDFQDPLLIGINFEVEDPESGIKKCAWAIGITRGDSSIFDFTEIPDGQTYATAQINNLDKVTSKLYCTLRCVNNAGLTISRSTDGVYMSVDKPSIEGVHIDVLEASDTQYPVFDHFHGKSNQLRVRWTGFKANDWIDYYQVHLQGYEFTKSVVVHDQTTGYVYVSFNDLNLQNGVYEILVRGINKMAIASDAARANVTILTTTPQINETENLVISWNNNTEEATVSWLGVFLSEHSLYYEVSVGKSVGNVDIIQWKETKTKQLKFKLPILEVGQFGLDIYAVVNAISPSGKYATVLTHQLVT